MPLRGPYFGSTGGQIRVPDYSGIAEAAKIRAGGDAALGQAIGRAIGDFGKSFFEKKKQKKLAESMAENPVVMEAMYGAGEDSQVPIEREQRVKDVVASIRSGGGTEKFIARMDKLKAEQQQQQRLDLAERMAASNEERAVASERRAAYLFQRGVEVEKGLKEFIGRAMGTTPVQVKRREEAPGLAAEAGDFGPPPAMERSPEGFLDSMGGLKSSHAQEAAYKEFVRRRQAQQAASTADLAKKIQVNEELRKQADAGRIEATLNFGTVEIDPKGEPVHRGLSLGSGNEARALTGSFSNKEEAVKAKTRLGMLNDSLDKINQLQEKARIYEEEEWYTGGTSTKDKMAAENLATAIQGQIREEILGPGTVTEGERVILEQLVPSGNKFFSFLSGEDGAKELENLKKNLMSNFQRYLETWGVSAGAPQGGTKLQSGSNIRQLKVRRL